MTYANDFRPQLRKETTMSIANLEEVFVHELRDILDAERQLVKALSKMAKAAASEDLQAAFEEHKSVTEEQIGRLETIFESLDKAARGKKCVGMQGLVEEGSELINEEEPGAPLDAALICAAQKVEHYEMASYGSLVAYAQLLGMDDAVELLETTLAEEKETDAKLTSIASALNLEAQAAAH
jgi:ferritin-like metal-binding protein YciE